MLRFHAYKKLPEYGYGYLGGITAADVQDLFHAKGLDFIWINEEETELEIYKEDMRKVIDGIRDGSISVDLNNFYRFKTPEPIADALEYLLNESDPKETYVKIAIF